jgi:hypothetical protein
MYNCKAECPPWSPPVCSVSMVSANGVLQRSQLARPRSYVIPQVCFRCVLEKWYVLGLVTCDIFTDAITNEIRSFLRYYAALRGNCLPTFRDIVLVPSSTVKKTKSSSASLPLRMGQICCPETSVNNYHTTLRNASEERRSHQHRGGSLKSRLLQTHVFSSLQLKDNLCMVKCTEFVSDGLWCVFQVWQQYCLSELVNRPTCARHEAGGSCEAVLSTFLNTSLPEPGTFEVYVEYRLFVRTI